MHLVELRFDADRPVQLRLHERLTAVVAPEPVLDRVRDVLSRVWVLAGTEVDGVVDAGGYLTPLDPTAVVALDLAGDGAAVVGPDRVPPPDPTRRAEHLQAAAADRDAWQAAVDHHTTALAELTRRTEVTTAAVEVGRTELDDSRARRADLDAQRAAVGNRPAAITTERAAAEDAATASRARIDELAVLLERLSDLLGEGPRSLRTGDDTGELVEVVERCGQVGGLSPTTLAAATQWLRALADGTAPVRPEAEELIRAEREIESAWQEAAAAGVEGAPEVLAAAAVRDALVEDRDALEALARNGLLGDTARSEIEAAHAAVGSARSHDQQAVRDHEDRILNRFGFDSYLDFTIAMSTRSVGQKAEGKLQRVVDELAVAEEELGRARQAAADRLERLAAAREPVRERIAAYLGEWPDGPAEGVLARIPAVPGEVVGLVDEVAAALDTGREELVRHTELVADLDEEAAGLAERLAEIDAQGAQVDARIAEIEGLLARAEDELAVLGDREAEATAARRDAEAGLAAAWRAHEELVDGAGSSYEAADVDPVADAVAHAVREAGPGPVLLADTFAPVGAGLVPALAAAVTSRVPGIQLVYLTADDGLVGWARGLSGDDGTGVVLTRRGWLSRRFGRRGRPTPAS